MEHVFSTMGFGVTSYLSDKPWLKPHSKPLVSSAAKVREFLASCPALSEATSETEVRDPEAFIGRTENESHQGFSEEKLQGLVNVPFWEYWTSPYSSHYRPYT